MVIVTHELTLQQPSSLQWGRTLSTSGASRLHCLSLSLPPTPQFVLVCLSWSIPESIALYLEELRKPFLTNVIPAVCILVIKTTCTWLVRDTLRLLKNNALRY